MALIILGTLSGIGLCYHLMRCAWAREPFDAPLVIGYAALIYYISEVLI